MKINRRFALAIVVFSALSLAIPAVAADADQGRGRGKAGKSDKAGKKDGKHDAVVVDRDGHVRIVHEYARAGSLPPGLAKRESLPPGLRKQLRERGALPPGLQKHLVPVPAPLLIRLPPVPPYYQRYFAGDDLLVIDTRSNLIVVILPNVWR